MIPGIENGFDQVVKFGTPYHGAVRDTTLTLPNAATMPAPGAAIEGGDFFVVQVPGQLAAVTTTEEAAAGQTWLNYGIISGSNHVFYGRALGQKSWLYVAPDASIWLVEVALPSATASITFKRFGLLGQAPAGIAQTVSITPGWTTVSGLHIAQDITPTGNKVIWSHRDPLETAKDGARGAVTILQGATLLTISGTPPAASVTWEIIRTAAECQGVLTDTMLTSVHGWYSIKLIDNTGDVQKLQYDVSYATNGVAPDTSPPVPSGYALYGPYVVKVTATGTKHLAGATIGALFDAAAAVTWVTFDAEINQSSINDSTVDATTYAWPIMYAGYQMRRRWGGFSLKIGGSVVSTIPVEYKTEFDASIGESATTLLATLGTLFSDTDPAHVLQYDFGDLNFDATEKRVMFRVSPAMVGVNSSGRFFPARFANRAYGIISVGGRFQEIDPDFSECSGSIVERAEAISVDSGAHATTSQTGVGALTKNTFAASHKVSGALLADIVNVAFV